MSADMVAATSKVTGQIKQLCDRYGFIKGNDGNEYFFLPRSVEPKGISWSVLSEGSRVSFAPYEDQRGLRADQVRILV